MSAPEALHPVCDTRIASGCKGSAMQGGPATGLTESMLMLVNVPCLDGLLERHAAVLGSDCDAYRNCTYRIVNLHHSLGGSDASDLDKLVIAAVYQDLPYWQGSEHAVGGGHASVSGYLQETDRMHWDVEITAMIRHRYSVFARYRRGIVVETFRQANWINATCGWRRHVLPRFAVDRIMQQLPMTRLDRALRTRFAVHVLGYALGARPS